jgi:hypothetical protein
MTVWAAISTPEFLLGAAFGLVLNVESAYIVRGLDRLGPRISSLVRPILEEDRRWEAEIAIAAASDSALYAALAAEASRERMSQFVRLLLAFGGAFVIALLNLVGEFAPGPRGVIERIGFGAFAIGTYVQAFRGFKHSDRAKRIERALKTV